jgi:hypothetical protein
MVWFAGLMVNAILRQAAIIIKSKVATVYGRFMAQFRQTQPKRFDDRFQNHEPVLDAEFEDVETAQQPSVNPSLNIAEAIAVADEKPTSKFATDKIGLSVFGKKYTKPLRDDSIAFYGFSAVLVMLSFWVSGGYSLFRQVDMMATASIKSPGISAEGVSEIADAAWRVVTIDGKNALHVEGIVRNPGTVAVHTKPVTVTVKHNNGSTKRYLLGQRGWTLGPGQEVVVSGRLDIMSDSIASVVIALSN